MNRKKRYKRLGGGGEFVATGEYRPPREGEWYLMPPDSRHAVKAYGRSDEYTAPMTILVPTPEGDSVTTIAETFPEKVAAGASYLDLAKPGWAESIDTDTLDLGSGSHCVLGQSMGDYIDGIRTLDISETVSRALGFNCAEAQYYEALTAAWIPAIQERQPQVTEIVVKNGTYINYRVKVDHNGYISLSRDTGGPSADRVRIGDTNKDIWRQVGQAFIDLSNQ